MNAMVNDMNATEKLKALQGQLAERGVVDVKFFFSKYGPTPTKVTSDVINVLEAMLGGKTRAFDGVGDKGLHAA